MCGIFAVLRKPGTRGAVPEAEIERVLLEATQALRNKSSLVQGLSQSASSLSELNERLKGPVGVMTLLSAPHMISEVQNHVAAVESHMSTIEADLDGGRLGRDVDLELLNRALSRLRDVTWSLTRDRVRTAEAVAALGGFQDLAPHTVESYTSVQLALSAIDRLEVRGRDSAGISVIVRDPNDASEQLRKVLANRKDDLLRSTSVIQVDNVYTFVYKAAAEIGALGDNVRYLRAAIEGDDLLREIVNRPGTETSVIAHTRWASVGSVSEANAHPFDSFEVDGSYEACVIASLNGGVDNYVELRNEASMSIADEITNDAKVIPVLVSRGIRDGAGFFDAFRSAVNQFEGSAAIAASSIDDADCLALSVRGSGQGCYVGLAEDAYLVASEPYGLVEECSTYLRLDGEAVSPTSGQAGQVIELRRDGAGSLEGVRRLSFGGEELPVEASELSTAEVTTRDIDRGEAAHFLLKEIGESPQSIVRTMRGKIADSHGRLVASLPDDVIPAEIVDSLRTGKITRIVAIGQGTAAVAASALAAALEHVAPGAIAVTTTLATELSGFGLRDDMSEVLIVAVSQSGTTTDTNRTVDLVRARGARVIAVVNRRQSDLTERADGVFYTSDGRDVEMAVASTKAFYAQVAAVCLLAVAIAETLPNFRRNSCHELLTALRELPEAMIKVLAQREAIADVARSFAPGARSWAIVGNGPNHIAARELRIKLSELCYRSVAVDWTEDKKHIDLSAEPMILVCAAGLSGSNLVDVAKEIDIYKAHKATPIVIASEGTEIPAAAETITVPSLHPVVDFILSTMVGHLFGYGAALAIDAQGSLMRTARAAIDDAVISEHGDQEVLLARLSAALEAPATSILNELRSGRLNGHLEPSTAVSISSLLPYATGVVPLDYLELETGSPTSPSMLANDLSAALSLAADELSRPIDAVKHQAKTVTVGISRTEESFVDNRLVQEVFAAGAHRDSIGYRSTRALVSLDQGVHEVTGFTRYAIRGEGEDSTIHVVAKGGVAQDITSRSESDPRLLGTKHRAAQERVVTVGRGQRDGRSVIIIPEISGRVVAGLTLLHVEFKPALDSGTARKVLEGYRDRYAALVDAVTETQPHFDEMRLAGIPLIELLVEPVWVLAKHWVD